MSDEENLELDELNGQGSGDPPAPAPDDPVEEAPAVEAPVADDENPNVTTRAADLEAVYDIPVQVQAVLGRATMQVSQLLKLGRGAVVELDRKVGEAVDIYVNNRLVARGEVVVVNERLGITMTEILKTDHA